MNNSNKRSHELSEEIEPNQKKSKISATSSSNELEREPIQEKNKVGISFKLNNKFVEQYSDYNPFKTNPLGLIVFLKSYSRLKDNGERETFVDVTKRMVEFCFSIQKEHIIYNKLGWDENKAQKSAQEMFVRILQKKFCPAGRCMFAAGTPITTEKSLNESMFNCGFVSTKDIATEKTKPFTLLMNNLMLGVGMSCDLRGANKIYIRGPNVNKTELEVIEDSREGWVKALNDLLLSYFDSTPILQFDYSKIRLAGTPLKTFGGTSSGFKPLEEMVEGIRKVLDRNKGFSISGRTIADIVNLIAVCVVSGNIRRSATLLLGDETEEFLNLKNYDINPERKEYGWSSNNSILAVIGQNYTNVAKYISKCKGEPGIIWLDNIQNYSRMCDPPDYKDLDVIGVNPCSEISLNDGELCNLINVFPTNCQDLEDFKRTLKYAYLFGKTNTLLTSNCELTNRVSLKNRRMGISLSGIQQFIASNNLDILKQWCIEGYNTIKKYDKIYSDWFIVRQSIKLTAEKPDGNTSCLFGTTSGIHFPESRFIIRRVTISKTSPLIQMLSEAGYKIEDSVYDKYSVIVEVPVDYGEGIRDLDSVSMWEQLKIQEFMQRYWCDNLVSSTVTYKEEEEKDINAVLDYFQYTLKSVSLLPRLKQGAYAQMPLEKINKEEYERLTKNLKPLTKLDALFSKSNTENVEGEKYCTNDSCLLNQKK